MISKLRDVLVWEELPMSGLQQICRANLRLLCEQQSKFLKGGYIRDYIGTTISGILKGILGGKTIAHVKSRRYQVPFCWLLGIHMVGHAGMRITKRSFHHLGKYLEEVPAG